MVVELIGFLLLALACLFAFILAVELRDAVASGWRSWRRARRQGGDPPSGPHYHFGASGFHLDGPQRLLHRRHRRRLELEPRGSFGFAAHWFRGG